MPQRQSQPLHQSRKAPELLRPRHRHRLRPMLRTTDPQHLRCDHRLELATVQVSPPPPLPRMHVHPLPTLQAAPRVLPAFDLDLHLSLLASQRHRFHVPRFHQAQNLLIQLEVLHGPRVAEPVPNRQLHLTLGETAKKWPDPSDAKEEGVGVCGR
jgi:hypothetical protein